MQKKGETIKMQTSGRPDHWSPANDQANAQTEQLTRLADEVTRPSWKTSVFWFSVIAAVASVIAAIAAITNP